MLNFKRRVVAVALATMLVTGGTPASQAQYPAAVPIPLHRSALASLANLAGSAGFVGLPDLAGFARVQASAPLTQPLYDTRSVHDPNGTGKFYMGREIAQVMGPGGIDWLDRAEREEEERPEVVIDALGLRGGEVVADLGAGSGFFTFRISPIVGKTGKVLAVDIDDVMLETIRRRAAALKITNVEEVKGSETDPRLPAGGVDVVLMVDVYHELAYPFEVMTKVRESLKPNGRVVFVEYRKEDPRIPIKVVHKMSVDQLTKEMKAVGLRHVRTVESLPSQHIVTFDRQPAG